MAYIGRDIDKISNVEVLDNITFDGSSSYTLQKGGSNFNPSSANTLLVSIDGVVQAGNFTVSGSTINFGTAVSASSTCNFILHYGVGLITAPADGTVTTAKLADSSVTTAKLNDASVSLAKLTATGTKDATTFLRGDNTFVSVAGGITVADQWRLTTSLSLSSGVETAITTNLEQVDTAGQGTIGTAMSQSSGVFTFPETGVYLVNFTVTGNINADTRYIQARIKATTDNSTYNNVAINSSFNQQSSGSDSVSNSVTQSLIDVTDTANVKVKFFILSANNATATGNSTFNNTHMTFIRLGDT